MYWTTRFLQRMKPATVGLSLILVSVVTLGASCFGGQDIAPPQPVELEMWRTDETGNELDELITAYTARYPHVEIKVKTLKKDEYEQELVEAWARGEGPDMFIIQNGRMGKYKQYMAPFPNSVTLTSAFEEKKFLKNELVLKQQTETFPQAERLADQFPQAVKDDVVFDNQVYGLPLTFDTLSMYYNRDLLAQAQIAVPPATWEEFVQAVKALVIYDDEKNIIRPAAALGSSENIPHFFDILPMIMMQNGAEMINESGSVLFGAESDTQDGRYPGIEALDFYTKFSSPTWETYTWDSEQPDALEQFTQGNLAFYFGYYKEQAEIEQRAPELNFSRAKVPQIDTALPVNMASYPVESVYVNSPNKEHAWSFINFITSETQARLYAETTGRIPARLTLMAEKKDDANIDIYVQQALTAKGWYHGEDPDAAQQAFSEMITSASERTSTLEDIITLGASKTRLSLTTE